MEPQMGAISMESLGAGARSLAPAGGCERLGGLPRPATGRLQRPRIHRAVPLQPPSFLACSPLPLLFARYLRQIIGATGSSWPQHDHALLVPMLHRGDGGGGGPGAIDSSG